jgi:aconitate hydratase
MIKKIPIPKGIYDKLPLSLKLLAWHCRPEDAAAFAAYINGEYKNVQTKASMLWFQDFTGVPELVNMAAQRDALDKLSLNPRIITARIKTHLVYDHSVTTMGKLSQNLLDEVRLNYDRMRVTKWAARAMNIKVIPPDKGVIHQINFEKYVPVFDENGIPTFGKGTDSHTPMVNALGILAWGIGGGEAQLVFNGKRIGMKIPKVVAINLTNKLRPGISSSDLAFYLKKIMREVGVKGAFVEFIGEGVDTLPVAARGTISNIAAEFGSRTAMFGIDNQTINFLALSDRDANVEETAKAYGMWRTHENEFDVVRSKVVDLDLSTVERGINGPDEPHLYTSLSGAQAHVKNVFKKNKVEEKYFTVAGVEAQIPNGALLLASIASCTHTANPDSILRAALTIKKAVEYGLTIPPWVKTAFASGSRVADQYLNALGLIPYIEKLGFGIAAHGCGACIGQSGGLNEVGNELLELGITPTSIVSSNRNYAGRQDANVSISFLGAPDLVVAYALVGKMDVDITTHDFGNGIILANLTPTDNEVAQALMVINKDMHTAAYENLFVGSKEYEAIEAPTGDLYDWPESVLVKRPPFFLGMGVNPDPIRPIVCARTLGIFGNNFSTDAISPAGEAIQIPAVMEYLASQGVVKLHDIISMGGYRSNDEIVMAGTFSNPTNQNFMIPGKKGGVTIYHPSGTELSIYHAAMRYKEDKVPLLVIGGENYGCGSSRVMAATGPLMLGVKAIIAVSFEAIHRSNLWQNAIVPLCFTDGQNAQTLGLDGSERWNILIDEINENTKTIKALLIRSSGHEEEITLNVMLEAPQEFGFLQQGGAMLEQLRELALEAEEV